MFIIEAILLARTQYVVYFLLSAWLEELEQDGSARMLPPEARQVPVRGAGDLSRRVAAVREKMVDRTQGSDTELHALREAAAALSVACERLRELSAEEADRTDGAEALAGVK